VASTGVAKQSQLNLSSNLIGCHWVSSLWTISHKKRILFCDLKCSEKLFGSISFFPEEQFQREITKEM
jgi:hypothetical protein